MSRYPRGSQGGSLARYATTDKKIEYLLRGVSAVDCAEGKVTKCHVTREEAKAEALRATQLQTKKLNIY